MPHYNIKLNKLPMRFYALKNKDDGLRKVESEVDLVDDEASIIPQDFIEKKTKIISAFYDEFTISDSKKPIAISLKNVRTEDELPLKEIQKEIQNAYNKGFADGQDVAKTTLEADIEKYSSWIKNFDTVANELKSSYNSEINKFKEALSSVAIIIAENIINSEISQNKNLITKNFENIFKQFEDEDIFKIKIHPENLAILEEVSSSLISRRSGKQDIEIVADDSVDKFSCVLETSAGTIDTRVKIQLEKIVSKMNQQIEESPDLYD